MLTTEERNAEIKKQILDGAKGKKPPVDDLEAEMNKRTGPTVEERIKRNNQQSKQKES